MANVSPIRYSPSPSLSLSLFLCLSISLSLSAKLRTLQEIDEQISDSLHDEQDIEKEMDEPSKFALYISKHRIRMQLWLKSQTETPENINSIYFKCCSAFSIFK